MPPTPIHVETYVGLFEAAMQRSSRADERTIADARKVLLERCVEATEDVRQDGNGHTITDRAIRMADGARIRSFKGAMAYACQHGPAGPAGPAEDLTPDPAAPGPGSGPGSGLRPRRRGRHAEEDTPLMMLVDAANASAAGPSGPPGPSGMPGLRDPSARPANARGHGGAGRGRRAREADGGDASILSRLAELVPRLEAIVPRLEALLPRLERLERLRRRDGMRIEEAAMLASEAMKQAVDGELRAADTYVPR